MGKASRKSLNRREFDILVDLVRQARERANLPQTTVARKIGLDGAIYRRIERRERVMDVVEFVDIAKAIGVDPLELFGDFLIATQSDRVSKAL